MWSILRYLQTVFKSDPDGDITYTYYRNTKTGATSTNLPSAKNMGSTGHKDRHLIANDNLNWRNHKLEITTKNCINTKPRLLFNAIRFKKFRDDMLDISDFDYSLGLYELKIDSTYYLNIGSGYHLIIG